MRFLILLGACGSSAAPIANTAPRPGPTPSPAACVREGDGFSQARIVDGAIVACYPDHDADSCWRFELASGVWRFASRIPHAEVAARPALVTATSTTARVCKRDGADCKLVSLAGGITVAPQDTITAATNADRSIVAVWTTTGPVHTFDMTGKRLATVKPWPTAMSGGTGPSVFRAAHVLGGVLEVRIADTPISSAIRLYDARTGNPIADVNGGNPMDDEDEPVELGGNQYAFLTIDERSIVVVDVTTGAQRARYPLGDVTLAPAVIGRAGGGLVGVIATTAFVVDGRGKVVTVTIPSC